VDEYISGSEQPQKLIICVHGFGTDRGDGGSPFFDLAEKIPERTATILIDLNSTDAASGMLKINDLSDQH
jgi:hypothetical protein